jgi:tetraacyldisaccharide 4'-kinase
LSQKPELEEYLLKVIRGEKKNLAASLIRILLAGLEGVYLFLLRINSLLQRPRRLPAPVISVGNIVVGGTGKTPTVVWLARLLIASGKQVAILTRGYGGTAQKEGRIFNGADLKGLTPEQTGDEPYLLASLLPGTMIAVGRDRYSMALQALRSHPEIDLFLLDDGFQYRGVQRELDIVLLDATNPFDNRHLIPRGLLREPLSALQRAQIILLTRSEQVGNTQLEQTVKMIRQWNGAALIAAAKGRSSTLVALREWGTGSERIVSAPDFLAGRRMGVVTAIGNPAQLEKSVRNLGAALAYFRSYPDHYAWVETDIAALLADLKSKQIDTVLITAKDAVKLRVFASRFQQSSIEFYVLGLDFAVEEPAVLAKITTVVKDIRGKGLSGK